MRGAMTAICDPNRHRSEGAWIPKAPSDLVAAFGAADRRLYVVPSMELVVTRLGDHSGSTSFDNEFWASLGAAAPRK